MTGEQPAPAPAVYDRPPGKRIPAVDIARGLAILGMFVAHTIALSDAPETIANGRSSILFATLAGVSLGIISGGSRPYEQGRRRLRTSIAIRAGFLIVLGLVLNAAGTYVAIILDFYGIMFLLVLPLLFLPRRALAVAALGIALVLPPINFALEELYPSVEALPIPLQLPAWWLFFGYYPALTWLAFLLVGLLCARSDLTRQRTQVLLVAGGGIAMLLGYGSAWLIGPISAEAHEGTTAEVIGSGGFAVAVLGGLLLLTSEERGGLGRGIRWLFWPVAAIGAMPLTIYTLQILAIAVFSEIIPLPVLLVAMVIGSLLFAGLWRPLLGRGPLERLVRWLSSSGTSRDR